MLGSVEMIDQNPSAKSSRSNPVTYLKAYDEIRKLFADQPLCPAYGTGGVVSRSTWREAAARSVRARGVIKVSMQFMADVELVCEACGGKRFRDEILEVKYRGKSIYDVLEMTVDDAIAFFGEDRKNSTCKRIVERLKPLQDVGLGYIKLGQSSSTLSGGESQRVKLASFLTKDSAQGGVMFIFDEPTTGLHFHDINKLLAAFNALIERGHTIVIVEHNMDVIKCADWVVDLGPEAGTGGGRVIFEGTPRNLEQCPASYTGKTSACVRNYNEHRPAGSRDERHDEYGLAHFTEHALFKGTHKRKAYQVNCRLENLGGELNAFTTKEDTTIHATTLRSDFAKAVELITDVAFDSTYPERELAKEREVIVDEINTYKDSPSDMIFDTFEDMIFEGSELGHNILGTKAALARHGTDSIRRFTGRTYTTDQMVFSSIGNFSVTTARDTAARYLAERHTPTRSFERAVPAVTPAFEKVLNKHTHQVHCIVGARAYDINDERLLAPALRAGTMPGRPASYGVKAMTPTAVPSGRSAGWGRGRLRRLGCLLACAGLIRRGYAVAVGGGATDRAARGRARWHAGIVVGASRRFWPHTDS